VTSVPRLVGAARALGAGTVAGLSAAEKRLLSAAPAVGAGDLRERIRAGEDPLGEALSALRSAEERRARGAIFTPAALVAPMLSWAARGAAPARVVEPGAGSARFLLAAARAFPRAELVGVEIDPVAALIARANLAAIGCAGRSRIDVADFRAADLGGGPTLFLGNPPYVRHHGIAPRWKEWLAREASARGLRASRLAGLHVHFLLAVAAQARPGDRGALVTSAEWLDVGYGALARALFLGPLGGLALHVLDARAAAFPGTETTTAVALFEVGARPARIVMRRAADLGTLGAGPSVPRGRLETSRRWSSPRRRMPRGFVELGEVCRVHRGQVTGANDVWIAPDGLELPARLLVPCVTRARELFAAGEALRDARGLRRVIDLPEDLDGLTYAERAPVERFLARARARGAHLGYVARARRAWWSVALREPAPILATYMARRPPAFVLNPASARHLNIAHGLYPRTPLPLAALAFWLRSAARLSDGRIYAGGLTKFEPGEMERLPVPGPEMLGVSDPRDMIGLGRGTRAP